MTFGLLLNLVGVMGEATKDQVWGYLANYVPEASARSTRELDRLIDHALAYARDFVAPTLQRRAPEPHEAEALRQLDTQLAALPAGRRPRTSRTSSMRSARPTPSRRCATGSRRCTRRCWVRRRARMGSFIALYGVDNSRKLIAEALAKGISRRHCESGATRQSLVWVDRPELLRPLAMDGKGEGLSPIFISAEVSAKNAMVRSSASLADSSERR